MRRKEFWIFLQYMSIPIITALLFLIWQYGFVGIMLAAFLDWLFVPAIIIAIISLVYTVRYRSKSKQNLIILSGHLVNILILVSYLVFEAPNRRCDASIMEMKQMNEDCSLVPYSSRVVFEYGAGAAGDICFPGREN